ncbi:hypothetical protein Tco_0492746 [Tanacetum coccineum]
MALESSSKLKQHTPASNVGFELEDGIIAFNNEIALLESKDPLYHPMLLFLSNSCISTALTKQPSAYYSMYLREFWYTAEVDDATKSINFTLSCFDKPLSFTCDEFSTIIGLKYSENYVPLPPKETVRTALETLGLVDENDTSISSTDLINSKTYNNEELKYFKTHHISATSFKIPSASKVPLTSYMLKVANISPETYKSLILPSREVNVGDLADKSLSRTNGADTQHAEKIVATIDATLSLDTSESAEDQGN